VFLCDAAPVEKKTICSFDLNEISAAAFKDAVSNIYWFEFFMGELPSPDCSIHVIVEYCGAAFLVRNAQLKRLDGMCCFLTEVFCY